MAQNLIFKNDFAPISANFRRNFLLTYDFIYLKKIKSEYGFTPTNGFVYFKKF